jgi:hypothetical protein
MSAATNATAKAFRIAALLLVGAGAMLMLAHGMIYAGAQQQEVSLPVLVP